MPPRTSPPTLEGQGWTKGDLADASAWGAPFDRVLAIARWSEGGDVTVKRDDLRAVLDDLVVTGTTAKFLTAHTRELCEALKDMLVGFTAYSPNTSVQTVMDRHKVETIAALQTSIFNNALAALAKAVQS